MIMAVQENELLPQESLFARTNKSALDSKSSLTLT